MKKKQENKETEKDTRIEELTDSLQRLQAEFENYKKRVERENQEFATTANSQLLRQLLGVMDSFELAVKTNKETTEYSKGIEMIYSQLLNVLEEYGVQHIECVGEKFDSRLHEAVLMEESDKEKNTILEEMQKGYTIKDKVLRHSKVKVSK